MNINQKISHMKTKNNYSHVVENSQHFDKLEQIINCIENQEHLEKDYVLNGLKNTQEKGFELKNNDELFVLLEKYQNKLKKVVEARKLAFKCDNFEVYNISCAEENILQQIIKDLKKII